MRREENWAVDEGRIRAFFIAQPDVTQTKDGFTFGGCQIRLIPVSRQLLGKWQHRTTVIMEGSDADVSRIYQRFFLRFLSAGG